MCALLRLSQAQQRVIPTDYFVTATGDTLRGQLQFSRFVADNGVTLLPAGGDPRRAYRAEESQGFGTVDGRRFVVQRIKFVGQQPVPASATNLAPAFVHVFMQHLVRGKANLYRLDYSVITAQAIMEYAEYQTTFFYIQVPGSGLLLLQQTSLRSVLKALFQDCPLAQSKSAHTRFDEAELSQTVLVYNTNCGVGFGPTADLRRSSPRYGRLIVGARAGLGMGLVSYQQSECLSDNTLKWMNNYIVGLNILSSSQHRVALATGLCYSWRRSSGTATHVVPAGFSNSGEVLSLEQRTAANTLQVPLLLRYSFLQTKSVAFIAAGAVPGCSISNSTSQTVLASTYDPHAFVPRQSAQPVTAQDAGIEKGALFGF